MPLVLPADLEAKMEAAVADRDEVDHADAVHSDTMKQLSQATNAEAAAKDGLIHAQATALQSAHDAIDGITAFLSQHPSPVVPPATPTP